MIELWAVAFFLIFIEIDPIVAVKVGKTIEYVVEHSEKRCFIFENNNLNQSREQSKDNHMTCN